MLQNLSKELLTIANEQHQQLGACALSSSTESESEAEEQERIRPQAETTSVEVANISWQHAALLRLAIFNTAPGTLNVRRGAAAWTSSTSSEEGEAGVLEDMAEQLPQVPDIPIVGSQKVQFMEPICQASTLMLGGSVTPKVGMSYVDLEPVNSAEVPVYHPGPRPVPRPRKFQSGLKHNIKEVAEQACKWWCKNLKRYMSQKYQSWKVVIWPMPDLFLIAGLKI